MCTVWVNPNPSCLFLWRAGGLTLQPITLTLNLKPYVYCSCASAAAHTGPRSGLTRRYCCLLRSGPSKRVNPKRFEHRPVEWGRRVCVGFVFYPGVARCGRSAGCMLCALWAVSLLCVCVWGGGVQPPKPVSLHDAGFAAPCGSAGIGFSLPVCGSVRIFD